MKSKLLDFLKTYIIITIGSLIVAFGVYFFSFPNNLSTGGTSSLSILVSRIVEMVAPSLTPYFTPGTIMGVVNVILLIIALIIFGKQFAFKTVYSSLLISGAIFALEKILPIDKIPGAKEGSALFYHIIEGEAGGYTITGDPLLELIFAIGCIAVGSAITFSVGASSGGTDIVAMILKKYTKMDISRALLVTDALLVLSSFFIFDIKVGLFSLLGLILKSFIVDIAIDGIYKTKCFYIITSRADEILDFINNKLHRGATVSLASGSFSHEDKKMILTVLSRGQAMQLKEFISKTGDGTDFTIITNSSDIIGKGFRSTV
jgi:uncharacterized membrane-anchored protein YitT (DUF2179 family)